MTTAIKTPVQLLKVPFDFSAIFVASGMTYATFSVTADLGLSVLNSTRVDDVVTVIVGDGLDAQTYALTVTALTDAGTFVKAVQVLVRAAPPPSTVPVGGITPAPPPAPAPAPTPAPSPGGGSSYADNYADNYA